MSTPNDVEREATHDWLNERDASDPWPDPDPRDDYDDDGREPMRHQTTEGDWPPELEDDPF